MFNKIFFASTSTCYDPIQSAQEREPQFADTDMMRGITVIKFTAMVAAAEPWDAALVPVLALDLVPEQQPESMQKEKVRMQA